MGYARHDEPNANTASIVNAAWTEEVSHRVHSLNDFTEHNMLSIKVRRGYSGYKKLRPVGVCTSICHREETRRGVLIVEILIWSEAFRKKLNMWHLISTFKLFSIDWLASCTILKTKTRSENKCWSVMLLARLTHAVKSPPWIINAGMTRWNVQPVIKLSVFRLVLQEVPPLKWSGLPFLPMPFSPKY